MLIIETVLPLQSRKDNGFVIDNLKHSIIYFNHANENILLCYIKNYSLQW